MNSAAKILGRLGGKKGGNARAAALSAEDRSEIARKAANTRWHNSTSDLETRAGDLPRQQAVLENRIVRDSAALKEINARLLDIEKEYGI